jgi:hypothetical protein
MFSLIFFEIKIVLFRKKHFQGPFSTVIFLNEITGYSTKERFGLKKNLVGEKMFS